MGMKISGFSIATTFLSGEYEAETFWLDNEESVELHNDFSQTIVIRNIEDYKRVIEETIKLSYSGDAFNDWFEEFGDLSALEDYYDRLAEYDFTKIKEIVILADTELEYRWERRFSWIKIHIDPFEIITDSMLPEKIEVGGMLISSPTSAEYIKSLADFSNTCQTPILGTEEIDNGEEEQKLPGHINKEVSDIIMIPEEFEKNFEFWDEKKKTWRGPKGLYINSYIGESRKVVVPSKVGKKTVVRVNNLGERPDVVNVEIPESVEILSMDTFKGCPNLFSAGENVIVGGRLIYLGKRSPKVVIPKGVKEVINTLDPTKNNVWFSDDVIEEIVFPEGVKKISGGFSNCKNLKKIVFPDSLEEVAGFKGCTSLEEVILPQGLKRVGEVAFNGCASLKRITISPETECGSGAFGDCQTNEDGFTIVNGTLFNVDLFKASKGSGSLVIPDNVTAIDSYALFKPGYVIDEVILHDDISFIDEDAFGIFGIERLALINHLNGDVIFETDKFKAGKRELSEVTRFQKVCKLICKKKYEELNKFGVVYKDAIPI